MKKSVFLLAAALAMPAQYTPPSGGGGGGSGNMNFKGTWSGVSLYSGNDVVIYTISTNISRIETPGDKVLRYLAQETGGLAFFPFKSQELAQSFENIANELRHQYALLYRPEPLKLDGQYHAVDVKVKNRKDLQVRVRRGYYAEQGALEQ